MNLPPSRKQIVLCDVMLVVSLAALVSCAGPRPSPWIPAVVVPAVKVQGAATSTAIGSIEITTAGALVP